MLSESFLPELDHEFHNARRTLERVPEDKLSWQPHIKSWPISTLARHIAQIPGWAPIIINGKFFNLAGPTADRPHGAASSVQELLSLHDANLQNCREAVRGAADSELLENWSLLNGEQTIFTLPRIAVLRSMVLNHMIHHRGQLTIYLRLLDVPIPGLYGPSADES